MPKFDALEFLRELAFTFFTAMIPVVELRGAIPFGIGLGLPPLYAYIAAVLGNLVPAPFIILLIRKIFALLRRVQSFDSLITRLEKKAEKKGEIIQKYRALGLIILVAIPLPGTGAWTGALAAAFLNIRLCHALPEILLGLMIAGGIVLGISCGVFHFI